MAGGVNPIGMLQGKVDSNNALVVSVDPGSTGIVITVGGTANQVLVSNGGAPATTPVGGNVVVSLSPTLTGIDSLTFSGGQSLVGTTADVTTLARSTNSQRFVLGLATSAYPALVRSGTTLKVRLGDDSADAPLSVSTISLSGGDVTVPTTNGMSFGANGDFRGAGDGIFQWRAGGGNGFRIDAKTTSGVMAVLSVAGADTATVKANKLQITGLPAFVASDKYVVVDSSGNFHVSALGPAS